MRRLLPATLATLALAALAAAPARAEEPWWQVLTGSRPTHLQPAPDETEVQRIESRKFEGEVLAAEVEVAGKAIGCLGSGVLFGIIPADALCHEQTDFGASGTAAELKELLEGPYGEDVEVEGGPAGDPESPLLITTPGRWVAPVVLRPLFFGEGEEQIELGSATAEAISEGSGRLTLVLTNLGDAPLDATSAPLEIVDRLPEGLTAYGTEAVAGAAGSAGPVECAIESAEAVEATDEVRCSFEDELPSYEAIEVDVLVALTGEAGEAGEVAVSGGDGPEERASQPITVSEAPVPFGLERFQMRAEAEGGGEADEAGTHPFQLTNTVQFRSGRQERFGDTRQESVVIQPALPRNVRIALPAGMAGSARATPTCELADFLYQNAALTNECNGEAAVGVASVTLIEAKLGLTRLAVPVFNLPPQHGEPARFGFMVGGVPVLIETSVDPEHDYRVIAEVRNAPQTARVLSSTVSLWGEPGDPAHDPTRGWGCVYYLSDPSECLAPGDRATEPFLRMPSSCAEPFEFEARVEAWNGAGADSAADAGGPLRGCNQVPFAPKITSTLTSKAAESPSGLDFGLLQDGSWPTSPTPGSLARAEAQAKRVEVTLPEGVTINPSQAEGLATCSQAEFARERYDSAVGEGCPEASKVGSIEVQTPILAETLRGAVYVAESYENPFDSLIAIYFVIRQPERGIVIRVPAKVEPDPKTGQLITTVDDLPQQPFSSFRFHFREGGRSPLITPPRCGDFETTARFVPYSAHDPEHPRPSEIVPEGDTTTIERGVGGGPCPRGGVPPFAPGFAAGSLNNAAGAFSPFAMRLTRKDGDQDMTRFDATLPPGVLGSLAGVSKCPETAIATAEAKTGKEELADPSCPPASQIGTTLAGAGVGSALTYVPGSLYLGGPVGSAPLSVIAITPAVAGPFDVGTVVVREALELNPVTAEVEVNGALSDPIPHILAGIPLKLRDLRVNVDRPNFTLNPTSCAESATRATLFGSYLDLFSAADDLPLALASRFQAAGCAALAFRPRLGLRLKGSTKRGGHPALRAVYVPKPGQANLKRMALLFPRSEFVENAHFRTICTRVQFAAGPGRGALCPKGSIYGQVKAWTPLLDEPLVGPVFLRSSDNLLPDAVIALHGIVDAEVSVRVDSVKGRLRTTVEKAPDVPVSRVVVQMRGGGKGLFVNSKNVCKGANRATARALGHNLAKKTLRPKLRPAGCKKRGRARRAALASGVAVR